MVIDNELASLPEAGVAALAVSTLDLRITNIVKDIDPVQFLIYLALPELALPSHFHGGRTDPHLQLAILALEAGGLLPPGANRPRIMKIDDGAGLARHPSAAAMSKAS